MDSSLTTRVNHGKTYVIFLILFKQYVLFYFDCVLCKLFFVREINIYRLVLDWC